MIPHLSRKHQGALLTGRPGAPGLHRQLADAGLFEQPEVGRALTPLGTAVRDAVAAEGELCPLSVPQRETLVALFHGWRVPTTRVVTLGKLSALGLVETGWLDASGTTWGWRLASPGAREIAAKWTRVWGLTNRPTAG